MTPYQTTSRVAYETMDHLAHADRILAELRRWIGGATCDALEIRLGLSHQTTSAALTGLHQAKLIRRTGEKRKTRTGRPAYVWGVGHTSCKSTECRNA